MKAKIVTLVILVALLSAGVHSSFAQADRQPKGPPDLIVKSATFYFTRAVVVVQNTGTGFSGKADLVFQRLAGNSASSPVQNEIHKTVPPLGPGKTYEVEFDLGGFSLGAHARRLIVDDTYLVAESNERNNIFFSNSDPVAEEGFFPAPAHQSNLTFETVKFVSPRSVHWCLKNIGQETSGTFRLRITIFAGAEKDSGIYNLNPFYYPSAKGPGLPGLKPYQPSASTCYDQSLPLDTFGESLAGHGRLIEIIPDNPALDRDSSNKSYLSPGTAGLWSHP